MTALHRFNFPRFAEDIASERRTLVHLLACDCAVGDGMMLLAFAGTKLATITKIDRVLLCPLSNDDLQQLCRNQPDRLHPEAPSGRNPVVYRIEFAYGFDWKTLPNSPEWSLAS